MSSKHVLFLFDALTNLTMNRTDSRIILNRGLVVSTTEKGLSARNQNEAKSHDSINSE